MITTNFRQVTKPEIKVNIPIALVGYLHWINENNSTFKSINPDFPLPDIPNDVTAITTIDFLNDADFHNMKLDDLSPECVEKLKQDLMKIGMAGYAEDGEITSEEWAMSLAAQGQAALEANPESFDISIVEIEAAKRLLIRSGIENPDDDLARGLAVNAKQMVVKVNEGLGIFRKEAVLHEKDFEISDSKFEKGEFASIQPLGF